jgi:uncharacterized membrane protein required for colicin V production
MWLDVVAFVLLAVFVAVGCWRGALASFVALAALAAGYGAAVLLAPALGPKLGIEPAILGVGLAGCGLFLAAYLAVAIAGFFARRAQQERSGGELGPRDRFLGGVFGALRGAFIVLLLSWLALWLDALRETGGTAVVPPVGDSAAARATSATVEATVGAALGGSGPGGQFVARLAARPALAVNDLQNVLANPHFEALREDELFWTYIEAGQVDTAMGRPSFLALARDEALRGELAALGLVGPEAAADEAAFSAAAGEVLAQVGPRLRGLRDDPAFQELVNDPEVVAMLSQGDHLALLGHPGFRQLVARVTAPAP